MSLTSYRAAPPRAISRGLFFCGRVFWYRIERLSLIRFGSDLLSHVLRRSTIGATALNCRVRDGIGCFARAMTTKPKKRQRGIETPLNISVVPSLGCTFCAAYVLLLTVSVFHSDVVQACHFAAIGFRLQLDLAVSGSNQAYRAISTSQLKALLLLHLWPIDVVVFHGSQGRPCFEGGFPLRCLQRLSCPNIATQHYRWHDNWSTSGSFTPVLSY